MTRIDDAFQQLAEHQTTISTIQTNQATIQAIQNSQSAMLETLTADNIDIKSALADINSKLDNSQIYSPTNHTSSTYHPSPNSRQPPLLATPTPTRTPKCSLTTFNGTNPHDWIFQADRFFAYYSTPEDQRVDLASFHMQGQALSWFQWMHRNNQISTWTALTKAIEKRFGPPTFLNPQATLFKLKQVTTVENYQSTFENLCNRITTLSNESILQCFISGLKTHIQNELHLLKPTTIIDAIEGAKLIEKKYTDQTNFPLSGTNQYALEQTNNPNTTQSFPQTPQVQTPKSPIPIKQLSTSEMQTRKQQGLCFNCDEKYHFGHRCKPTHILMILPESSTNEHTHKPDTTTTIEPDPPPINSQHNLADSNQIDLQEISFHALMGSTHPRSIRFPATINGNPLSILLDTGSTHNYIHPKAATFLGLNPDLSNSFVVIVGNGEKLRSAGSCSDVQVNIQGHQFAIDFHLLEIAGFDAVCGGQWLETLGPITVDYKNLTVAFNWNGKTVCLSGLGQEKNPTPIWAQQLQIMDTTTATFQPFPASTDTNDLEDKVNLQGVGIDMHSSTPSITCTHTRQPCTS